MSEKIVENVLEVSRELFVSKNQQNIQSVQHKTFTITILRISKSLNLKYLLYSFPLKIVLRNCKRRNSKEILRYKIMFCVGQHYFNVIITFLKSLYNFLSELNNIFHVKALK